MNFVTMEAQMVALVDGNNFYVSCERVFEPTLRHKAVVVLSNNDGCVVSLSDEAKKVGITRGMLPFSNQELFEKNEVVIFSSNYRLYGEMSNRMNSIYKKYTPLIEQYSIDESFLYFEGYENYNLEEHCKQLRQDVLKQTLIPIGIGVAPTKALAKLANRIAKKFPQFGGVYCIDSEEKRTKALKWLDVGDIWGIGRQHTKRLKAMNVHTAYQFTQLADELVRKNFSVVELRIKMELQGIPSIEIEEIKAKQHIATTRSFDILTTDKKYLEERIVTYAVICAEKLRKQKTTCRIITVFITTNRFREQDEQYYNSINITLPFATNSSIEIAKYARIGLEKIFKAGLNYKKAGAIVGGIEPEDTKQFNLFEDENPKHTELMKVVDKLNSKYGERKLKLGGQDLQKTWKMRQERLSRNYTSDWNELLEV